MQGYCLERDRRRVGCNHVLAAVVASRLRCGNLWTVLALLSVPVAKAGSRVCSAVRPMALECWGANGRRFCAPWPWRMPKQLNHSHAHAARIAGTQGQQLRLSGRLAACRGCSGLLARICRQNGGFVVAAPAIWAAYCGTRVALPAARAVHAGCLAAFRPLRACFRSGRPWALAAALVAMAGSWGGP